MNLPQKSKLLPGNISSQKETTNLLKIYYNQKKIHYLYGTYGLSAHQSLSKRVLLISTMTMQQILDFVISTNQFQGSIIIQ